MNNTTHTTSQYDHDLLNAALRAQAEKFLWDKLKESMQADIKSIAAKAVANWAEVKFRKDPGQYYDTNINIQFVEHLIKTEFKDHPITINIKE